MIQYSTPSLVAVATGVLGSAWASGAIASFSFGAVPAIKAVPQTASQTWRELYSRGAATMPKVALVVALSYGYAAYDTHSHGGQWIGFAAAAATTLTIVPFTLGIMAGTNTSLTTAAKAYKPSSDPEVSSLLDTWTLMNYARSLFPLIGAVVGVMAYLANVQ